MSLCQVVPPNQQPGLRMGPVLRGAVARIQRHQCAREAEGSAPARPGLAARQGTAGKGTHHGQGVGLACGCIMSLYHDLLGYTGSPSAVLLLQYVLVHK